MSAVMSGLRIVAVSVVMALATWFVTWWTVPLLALLYGALRSKAHGAPMESGVGAVVAWGALLGWQMTHPAFWSLNRVIGDAMQLPPVLLMLVTLLFAGLMGWSGARLAHTGPETRRGR